MSLAPPLIPEVSLAPPATPDLEGAETPSAPPPSAAATIRALIGAAPSLELTGVAAPAPAPPITSSVTPLPETATPTPTPPPSVPTPASGTPLISSESYDPLSVPHPGGTPWNRDAAAPASEQQALRSALRSDVERPRTTEEERDHLRRLYETLVRDSSLLKASLAESKGRIASLTTQLVELELAEARARGQADQLSQENERLRESMAELSVTDARKNLAKDALQTRYAAEVKAHEAKALRLRTIEDELGRHKDMLEQERQRTTAYAQRFQHLAEEARTGAAQQASLEEQVRRSLDLRDAAETRAATAERLGRQSATDETPLSQMGTFPPLGTTPLALACVPRNAAEARATDPTSVPCASSGNATFSSGDATATFASLWRDGADSAEWRSTLRSDTSDNAAALHPFNLPQSLSYVDQRLVRPHAAELCSIDGPHGQSSSDFPDPSYVVALARRARVHFGTHLPTRPEPPPPSSLHYPPLPPTAKRSARDDDESSSGDESHVLSHTSGRSARSTPHSRSAKPDPLSAGDLSTLRPPRTKGVTPSSSSGSESDSSASTSDGGEDLLPVRSKFISGRVQDREHVLAVKTATGTDKAGLTVGRRCLYTQAQVDRREESIRRNSKGAMTAGKDCMNKLIIPSDLSSQDPVACGIAYKQSFRVAMIEALQVLQLGAYWDDVLRSMNARFSRDRDGHARLAQFAQVALRDKVLHSDPLLHAEAFMFKLDASFYSRVHAISNYELITSRAPTMDAATLMARIVEAYVEKLDDNKYKRKNILADKQHRQELFKKARRCLLADERDKARGKAVSDEFNRLWGAAEFEYSRNPTKAGLVSLDLQTFADVHLKEVSDRFERMRGDEEAVENQERRKADKQGAVTVARSRRDRAAGAVLPRVRPTVVLNRDDDDRDEPEVPLVQTRVALAAQGKVLTYAAATQRKAGSEPPPNPLAPPYAACAVSGSAAPDPSPSSRSPDGTASNPNAPSGRRYCPHPAGSRAEPSTPPEEWTKEKWHACQVDFDRLDQAVLDGQKTSVYASAAKARPAGPNLSELRLGRYNRPDRNQPHSKDACTYCYYRPKAKGNDARADNPDFWRFGNGDGSHHPGNCLPFKRYLAEGGDPTNTPKEKQFLQSALRYTRRMDQ